MTIILLSLLNKIGFIIIEGNIMNNFYYLSLVLFIRPGNYFSILKL